MLLKQGITSQEVSSDVRPTHHERNCAVVLQIREAMRYVLKTTAFARPLTIGQLASHVSW
jgi:hypothetical protein